MQSVKQVLTKAKALIQQPENWTQNAFARNQSGQLTSVHDTTTTCWCSLGAINKVTTDSQEQREAKHHLRTAMFNHKIEEFNDSMTHKAVMEAWDRAIQTAP